jgi:hypothetical protein
MKISTALSPLLPPSLEEWAHMAETVLVATQMAYAIAYVGEFDDLSGDCKAEVLAAIRNANSFYLAMANVTADALAVAE